MSEVEFNSELEFEHALIRKLFEGKGWEREVLKSPTEQDLMDNWAAILFQNNRQVDRLNNYPLTKTEMQQLVDQINELRTPFHLNGFINGRTASIRRDNPDDKAHLGKVVSLKLYDRNEIAGGESRYQIAEQPRFKTHNPLKPDRRGDFMLLINGMPVIHVELKKSDNDIVKATNQIEKYTKEQVFRYGIFSLVQIFVAMTPNKMLYFANPGYEGTFNKEFFFHWANPDNVEYKGWRNIAEQFFYIPLVHQLIGFYTVADKTDGTLKVMRSYQYWAARAISLKVAKIEEQKWTDISNRGGYIAHATGSGKTMTSFKSALLIADSGNADKVVFLVDRIELDTQSTLQYQNFSAAQDPEVQDTADTNDLIAKLKNDDDILIVTSIQKMSRVELTDDNRRDIEKINGKRIVVILDECHRSTFGDMLIHIRSTFKEAVYFGFTGTPIKEENQKKLTTTKDLFGDELHRYSLADAISDGNVLGFDPYSISTFDDTSLRQAIALEKAHAGSEADALNDGHKKRTYLYYMNEVPMAGYKDEVGIYHCGIEDYIPESQYKIEWHRKRVVEDIKKNWVRLSMNGKYHALLATNSISEAVAYYKLLKAEMPELKVTCLFDPTDDNDGNDVWKEEAITEMLTDYGNMFDMKPFKISQYSSFKKDVASRLAHKDAYQNLAKEEQLNILVVVNQMLTGYDSKWLNTLYLDKVLQYELLIQAFSRTNRLAGWDKQNGIIRYYRKVHTMERNIKDAVKLYAGDKALEVFVSKLPENIRKMNNHFMTIKNIFETAGIENFGNLPQDDSEKTMFAKEFSQLTHLLEAAKLQDFNWQNPAWVDGHPYKVDFDEMTYNILLARYKELLHGGGSGTGGSRPEDPPYDIDTHITEIETDKINEDYMNSRFTKYVRSLQGNNPTEQVVSSLEDLHRSFVYLSKEDQDIAEIVLGDFQNGKLKLDGKKTLREYISDYKRKAKDDNIHRFAFVLGMDESILREIMTNYTTEDSINAYGRLDNLEGTIDPDHAQHFIESVEHKRLPMRKVMRESDHLIREFIKSGGFDVSGIIEEWPELHNIEDDHYVKDFIDMEMSSTEGTTIEKLWSDVQHEFHEKYAGTSSQQWYKLVKDYVISKTHNKDISDDEIFSYDMAAEP